VAEARETEIAINENRNQYRKVAARGAMLFFLLNSLNMVRGRGGGSWGEAEGAA
jgi:dynein heavy chain